VHSDPPTSNTCSPTSLRAGWEGMATDDRPNAATPPTVRGFKALYDQLWAAEPRDPCSAYSPGSDARLAYTRISKVHGRGRRASRSLTSEERAPPPL
jgi:hypothetical protein